MNLAEFAEHNGRIAVQQTQAERKGRKMNLQEFAERYHLRVKRDECGDVFIPGTDGHIGDGYNDGLGAYVSAETVRAWTFARRKLESAGMRIRQNGDVDGVAVFDPANREQVRLALKLAGIRTRRTPSAAQLAVLARARETRLKAA